MTGGNWKLFSLGPRITDRLVVEVYSPSKLAGIGFVAAACTYSIELRPTLMYNGKVTGVQGGLPPPHIPWEIPSPFFPLDRGQNSVTSQKRVFT